MSIFGRLYSGVYDAVYGYKLSRFRGSIKKSEKSLIKNCVRKLNDKALDRLTIKHILIIKNEAFGDMIMVTPLIRNLAINGFKVDVMASEANQVIIEHNPYVNEIIVQTGGPENSNNYVLEHMKERHYDMVLDVRYPIYYDDIDRLLFPQHIPCDYLVGWNRSNIGIYDESLEFYDGNGHFSGVIDQFLNYLGVEGADLSYDLFTSEQVRENGLHYVRDLWRKGGPVVVFNPFSSHTSRDLTNEQVESGVSKILESYPFAQIVLTGMPDKVSQIKTDPLKAGHVHKYISPSIMDVISLIKYADIVITPDTSIVHIAAAFQKPTVALYISAERISSNGKDEAKRDYYQQMQLLKDRFFDVPKLEAGVRPERSLLNDHMFAPNNEKAVQLFSNTGNMADLASDNIMDVFKRLVTQFVRDAQYVAPLEALALTDESTTQADEGIRDVVSTTRQREVGSDHKEEARKTAETVVEK